MTAEKKTRLQPGTLPEGKELFRVDEAAVILGVCPQSVYRYVDYGLLLKLPRRGRIAIPRAELENFITERKRVCA